MGVRNDLPQCDVDRQLKPVAYPVNGLARRNIDRLRSQRDVEQLLLRRLLRKVDGNFALIGFWLARWVIVNLKDNIGTLGRTDRGAAWHGETAVAGAPSTEARHRQKPGSAKTRIARSFGFCIHLAGGTREIKKDQRVMDYTPVAGQKFKAVDISRFVQSTGDDKAAVLILAFGRKLVTRACTPA